MTALLSFLLTLSLMEAARVTQHVGMNSEEIVTASMTTTMTLEQTLEQALAKRTTANRCVIVAGVVDESGSMQTEQEWIVSAIPKIFTNLLAQGFNAQHICLYGFGFNNLARTVRPCEPYDPLTFPNTNPYAQFGGREDTYKGIMLANDETLSYISGNPSSFNACDGPIVKLMIVATDEDRDVAYPAITKSVIQTLLSVNLWILNTVASIVFNKIQGFPTLGRNTTDSFFANAPPAYDIFPGTVGVSSSFGSSVADFFDITLSTGGAVWDINILESNNQNLIGSFSNAFVDIKVEEGDTCCQGRGDPHITTYMGNEYKYWNSGEHVLTRWKGHHATHNMITSCFTHPSKGGLQKFTFQTAVHYRCKNTALVIEASKATHPVKLEVTFVDIKKKHVLSNSTGDFSTILISDKMVSAKCSAGSVYLQAASRRFRGIMFLDTSMYPDRTLVEKQGSNLGGFCQGFHEYKDKHNRPLFYTPRAPMFSEVDNQMSLVNLKNPCHAGLEFPMDRNYTYFVSSECGPRTWKFAKNKGPMSLVAEIAPNFDGCSQYY